MPKSKFRKIVTFIFLISLLTFSLGGCFGKYALVHRVVDFNSSIDDPVVRSLVCGVFTVIPVYGVAWLLDWVVFNVIEYYTGDNPLDKPITITTDEGDAAIMEEVHQGDSRAVKISLYQKGKLKRSIIISKDNDNNWNILAETENSAAERRVFSRSLPSGRVLITEDKNSRIVSEMGDEISWSELSGI